MVTLIPDGYAGEVHPLNDDEPVSVLVSREAEGESHYPLSVVVATGERELRFGSLPVVRKEWLDISNPWTPVLRLQFRKDGRLWVIPPASESEPEEQPDGYPLAATRFSGSG